MHKFFFFFRMERKIKLRVIIEEKEHALVYPNHLTFGELVGEICIHENIVLEKTVLKTQRGYVSPQSRVPENTVFAIIKLPRSAILYRKAILSSSSLSGKPARVS
jgi:hypothetical protein